MALNLSLNVDLNEIDKNTSINLDTKKVTVNEVIGLVDDVDAQKVTNIEALKCESDLMPERQCHLYPSLSLAKLKSVVNTVKKADQVIMDKSVSGQPNSLVVGKRKRIVFKGERKTENQLEDMNTEKNKKKEVKIDKRNGERIDLELKLKVKDLKEKIKLFETKEEVIDSERKKS